MRSLAKFRAMMAWLLVLLCILFTGVLLLSASVTAATAQPTNDAGVHVTADGDGMAITNDGERTITVVVESDGDYAGEGTYGLAPGETIRLPMPTAPMTVTATATGDDWRLEATVAFEERTVCGETHVIPARASYEYTAERGGHTYSDSAERSFDVPEHRCSAPDAGESPERSDGRDDDRDASGERPDSPDRERAADPTDRFWTLYERATGRAWGAYGAAHDEATSAYDSADGQADEAYARGRQRAWATYETGRSRFWSGYERLNETLRGDDNESDDGSPVDGLQDRANDTVEDGRNAANRVVNDGQEGANRVIDDGQDLANRTAADARERANRVIDDGQAGVRRIREDLENDSERLPGGGPGGPPQAPVDPPEGPPEPPQLPPEPPVEPPQVPPEQPDCEDAPEQLEERLCGDGGGEPPVEPPESPPEPPGGEDVSTDVDAEADAGTDGTDAWAEANVGAGAEFGDASVGVERGFRIATAGGTTVAVPFDLPADPAARELVS